MDDGKEQNEAESPLFPPTHHPLRSPLRASLVNTNGTNRRLRVLTIYFGKPDIPVGKSNGFGKLQKIWAVI